MDLFGFFRAYRRLVPVPLWYEPYGTGLEKSAGNKLKVLLSV